jgi:predicted enzyme related to lactoylglutathione lyase
MLSHQLAFIMYPVSDISRSVAFYEQILGLKKAGLESDFWVEFEIGTATFGIGSFEQVGVPGSAQSLALEVADLDAMRQDLVKRSIDTTEPHEFPSCRISVVRDPDGNQIWLHEVTSK